MCTLHCMVVINTIKIEISDTNIYVILTLIFNFKISYLQMVSDSVINMSHVMKAVFSKKRIIL